MRILVVTVALLFGYGQLAAAERVWTGGGGDNNWSTTGNWSGGVAPVDNDTVRFNALSVARLDNTCDLTLTGIGIILVDPSGAVEIAVSGSLSLGSSGIDMSAATQDLTFDSPITLGASQNWTIAADRTIDADAIDLGATTLSLLGSGDVRLENGVVSGAGAILSNGPRTILGSGHTFSGGVSVQSGSLRIAGSSTPTSGTVTSGPLGTGTLTVAGGAIMSSSNSNHTLANPLAVTGSCTIGDASLRGRLTFTGGVSIANSPSITLPSGFKSLSWTTETCTLTSDLTIATDTEELLLTGGFTFSGIDPTITLSGSGEVDMAGAIVNAVGTNTLTLAGTHTNVELQTLTGACGGLWINGPTVVANSASTFTGGVTLQSGSLNLPRSSSPSTPPLSGGNGPIGTGTLTVLGGTIYSSGDSSTRTLANPLVVQASCTFGGANHARPVVFTGGMTISGNPTITYSGRREWSFTTTPTVLNSDLSVITGDYTIEWLGGITTAADRTLTVNGPSALTLGGDLAGAGSLTLAGAGVATLNTTAGANGGLVVDGCLLNAGSSSTFSSGVELRSGIIRITRDSLGTPPTITSGPLGTGTITLSGGQLGLGTGNDRALGNPITLAGSVILGDLVGNDYLQLDGAITQTTVASIFTMQDLILTGSIDIGGHLLTVDGRSGTSCTVNSSGSSISGAGGLTKAGASELTLGYAHSYSGPTTVSGGTLTLIGNTGTIANSSALTVESGATFSITNTNGTNIDRLGDSIDVTLQGGTFTMGTATQQDRTETIGRLLVAGGACTLTLSANDDENCQLTCADGTLGLVRKAGASLQFNRNPDPGGGTANLFVSNGVADDQWLSWTTVTESGTTSTGTYQSSPNDGLVQTATLPTDYTTQAAGNWSAGSTWVGGSAPSTGSTVTILHAVTMNVSDSVQQVIFPTDSGSGSIVADTGILTVTEGLVVSGSSAASIACPLVLGASSIDCNHIGSGTFTLSGVISGANDLNLLGPGTVHLSGANTFSGGCTLNGGVLELGRDSSGAITNGPVGTGTLTLAGGTLRAGGGARAMANPLLITSDLTLDGSNDLTLSGSATINTALTMTISNSGSTVLSGSVGGTADWTKAGAGALRLSGANGFSGDLLVNAGTLQAWHNSALGTTAGGVEISNGTSLELGGGLTISGETITLGAGDGSSIGTLHSSSGGDTWTGPVLIAANDSILSCAAGILTIDGAISSALTGTDRSLLIDGAGTTTATSSIGATLNGIDTITKQGAGTFTTTQVDGLDSDIAMTVSAGTWDLADVDQTILNLSGAGSVDLGSATLTLSDCGGLTYSGAISGSGVVDATDSWTLSGQSTFSGGLIFRNGTLTIGADSTPLTPPLSSGPLGTGTLTLSWSPTIRDDGSLRTVGNALSTDEQNWRIGGNVGLTVNGPVNLTGWTNFFVNNASCTFTLGGTVSDGGIEQRIRKYDPGTLALGGSNTITTTEFAVYGGTLSIAADANLGSVTDIQLRDGSDLQLTGNITTSKRIVLYNNDNSVISVDPGMTATWNGRISGNYDLTKTGDGTLVLGATDNSYGTGKTTTVSAGTLTLANASGSGTGNSSVTVASGATLAGTGSCSGAVTMAAGSTLSPGSGGVGSLSTGDLALGATTSLAFDLGASSDQVVVSGTLTTDGDLTVTDSGSFGAGTYTLMTYTGALTDNRIAIASLPGATHGHIDTSSAGQINLQVSDDPNTPPSPVTGFIGPINCPDAGTAGPTDDLIDTYGRVLNVRPRLIWDVPTDNESQGLHFQIYLDDTNASTLVADSTIAAERGRFQWYNGASWVAVPNDGVTAGSGRIRYTPSADLTANDDHFYLIRTSDGSAEVDSATQRFIRASRSWTDTLTAGSSIRVVHMTELREEANRARNAYSLADVAWTDPTITPGVTHIRATHFNELRTGLTDVRDLTGTSVTVGAEAISAGIPIKTGHITELRTALDGL